jgi:flagellar motility protein MotE (MotC chaperone)
MFTCRTTSRSLSWFGSLTALVLGVLLLPLMPTWGQAPEGDQPKQPSQKANEKAMQEVYKKLQAEMEKNRKELVETEKKLAELATKLQQAEASRRVWFVQGTGAGKEQGGREIILREVNGRWIVVSGPEHQGAAGGFGGAGGSGGAGFGRLAGPDQPATKPAEKGARPSGYEMPADQGKGTAGLYRVGGPSAQGGAPGGTGGGRFFQRDNQQNQESQKRLEALEERLSNLERLIRDLKKEQRKPDFQKGSEAK